MTHRETVIALILGVLLGGLLFAPSGLVAQLGCWGSLCQDASGTVYLNGPLTARGPISLSTKAGALTLPGDVVLACVPFTVAAVVPGPGAATLRARPGAVPGTMSIVVVVGTGGFPQELPIPSLSNLPGGSC